jgi:hypothetical protein
MRNFRFKKLKYSKILNTNEVHLISSHSHFHSHSHSHFPSHSHFHFHFHSHSHKIQIIKSKEKWRKSNKPSKKTHKSVDFRDTFFMTAF